MSIKSLKDQYIKLLSDRISVSVEDLTDNEAKLIDESYYLFKDKLDDMKILNDEIKRLSIELANLKAMNDDKDYGDEDNANDN